MRYRQAQRRSGAKPFGGISAAMLRLLALALMLCDHLWATVVPGSMWLTYLGRLAFPIFAFQLVEGYFHTASCRNYALRLFLFAMVSEIPFNLFYSGSVCYPFHQNVMFTLLLGLWAVSGAERLRRHKTGKDILLGLLTVLASCVLAAVSFVDYGIYGVLTVLVFYCARGLRFEPVFQAVGLLLLYQVLLPGEYIPLTLPWGVFEFYTQAFGVFAVLPIWLYNGEKGGGGKALQYGSYLFYPVHMLLLGLIVLYS